MAGAPPWAALAAWVVGLAALGVLVRGTALGWSSLGGGVRQDANLIATRGTAPVRRWIVAHLDTKAQGQSMAGRVVAVVVALLALLALTALAVAAALGAARQRHGGLRGGAGPHRVRAGGPRGAAGARRRGPGQRDRAPGRAGGGGGGRRRRVSGVLITGAEEFGLVGARVFAREFGPQLVGVEVINVDTVDDQGTLYVVSHDAPGARLAASLEPAVAGVAPRGAAARAAALGLRGQPAALAHRGGRRSRWRGSTGAPCGASTRRVTPPTGLEFRTAEALGRLVATPI